MGIFKNEALNQAREHWQNAASGFTLRAMPYGAIKHEPINEADLASIASETKLAIDRLEEAAKILAEEAEKSIAGNPMQIEEADLVAIVKSMSQSIDELGNGMEFMAKEIDQAK